MGSYSDDVDKVESVSPFTSNVFVYAMVEVDVIWAPTTVLPLICTSRRWNIHNRRRRSSCHMQRQEAHVPWGSSHFTSFMVLQQL